MRISYKIQKGDSTIELTGDSIEEIRGHMDKAMDLLGKKAEIQTDHVLATKSTEMPLFAGVNGLSEALNIVGASDWVKAPKTSGEITELLKCNALHFPAKEVCDRLTKMTRSGVFRRFKEGKSYKYTNGIKSKQK